MLKMSILRILSRRMVGGQRMALDGLGPTLPLQIIQLNIFD